MKFPFKFIKFWEEPPWKSQQPYSSLSKNASCRNGRSCCSSLSHSKATHEGLWRPHRCSVCTLKDETREIHSLRKTRKVLRQEYLLPGTAEGSSYTEPPRVTLLTGYASNPPGFEVWSPGILQISRNVLYFVQQNFILSLVIKILM